MPGAADSLPPFLDSDPVLGDVDEHFSGDYLNEGTILMAARDSGMATATIGKLGLALISDHTERTGQHTIVVGDMTERPGGIPLSDALLASSRWIKRREPHDPRTCTSSAARHVRIQSSVRQPRNRLRE